MRKEVKQEVVLYRDVTVYVADDGTEFRNRTDCERYELETLKKPLLAKLQRCDAVRNMANFNGEYISDLNDYEWYFIRNEEDMRYEEQMLDFNKKLYPEIKNLYINCSKDMKLVSSTAFRALINQPERWNEYLTEEVIKVLLKAL